MVAVMVVFSLLLVFKLLVCLAVEIGGSTYVCVFVCVWPPDGFGKWREQMKAEDLFFGGSESINEMFLSFCVFVEVILG